MTKEFKRDSIWIARDGSEWRILAVDGTAEKENPIVAECAEPRRLGCFTLSGSFVNGEYHEYDLIREKRAPREFLVRFDIEERDLESHKTIYTVRIAGVGTLSAAESQDDRWIKVREVIE